MPLRTDQLPSLSKQADESPKSRISRMNDQILAYHCQVASALSSYSKNQPIRT